MKVVWSPLAEQRALEAVDFIAQDRPAAAAAWLEKLLARVKALERFEQQGRVVREIGLPAYREVLHAPYRIIYRVDAARVVILTLRHERRAWDAAEVSGGV
ncbi:MAG: type II toxin-antitoxin system RelE/ParE family toxin [Gemmatimonadaceae bacterium]|nr:type II toxin-antitoxin system RelE/ParE family toxin [Gemmatimonadaceae bacterium]